MNKHHKGLDYFCIKKFAGTIIKTSSKCELCYKEYMCPVIIICLYVCHYIDYIKIKLMIIIKSRIQIDFLKLIILYLSHSSLSCSWSMLYIYM